MVRKKTALEPFSRDTLLLSVYDSLKHRKTALEDAQGLIDTILHMVLPRSQQAVVESGHILEACLVVLRRFDTAAAIHYAAYHPV